MRSCASSTIAHQEERAGQLGTMELSNLGEREAERSYLCRDLLVRGVSRMEEASSQLWEH